MRDIKQCYLEARQRGLTSSPIVFINTKTRLLFEIVIGTAYYLLLTNTLFAGEPNNWSGFVFSIWLFVFISEGIFAFNKLISCKHPWHTHTRQRIVLLIVFSAIWFVIAIWMAHLFKPLIEDDKPLTELNYNVSIVISILFVIIYVVILFSYNYHQSLSQVLLENEGLKQDKLKQDYRALQDQVNPHFLFNNLSTLIAIIRQDKEAAIRFAINFSDVYRYVLQSNKHTSIRFEDELNFLRAYGSLHKERLRDGLIVEHKIEEKYFDHHLPPLSMQLLVENAIKHNVATKLTPLKLNVYTEDNKIIVANNINAKHATYSTNTGLSNLKERYKILTDQEVKIIHTENEFRVELPLIKDVKK